MVFPVQYCKKNGHKWSNIVQMIPMIKNSSTWSNLVKNCSNGPEFTQIFKNEPEESNMVRYGLKQMVQYCPKWSNMIKYSPIWFKMVHNGPTASNMDQNGPKWSKVLKEMLKNSQI